jgi:hypothetical protein
MQQIAQTADQALQAAQAFRVNASMERAMWSIDQQASGLTQS